MIRRYAIVVVVFIAFSWVVTSTAGWLAPQTSPDAFHAALARAAEISTLAAPGAAPFHLKLTTVDATMHSAAYAGEVEIWWETPERWRREIKFPDFTQSAVRNGATYFESTGPTDYLPYWIQELATAAIDPIPLARLKNINTDDDDGRGCWKWETEHGASAEKFSSYCSMCFNSNGTASQIFVDPPSLTLNAYQAFGDKMIAHQLVVWPGDRSNVTATVAELEPLSAYAPKGGEFPDGLFAVARDTGLDARLRAVEVPDTALEAAPSGGNPAPSYPPSFTFPLTGVIAVTTEIDRSGNVRGFPQAISKNQALHAVAIAEVRNWKFKPYVVGGVPVEVITTLNVPYHLKYEPLGAAGKTFPEISFGEHMAQSRVLSDLRAAGGTPYQLHATFTLADKRTGEYEETWGVPSTWVRKASMGKVSAGQVTEDGPVKNLQEPRDPPAPELVAVITAMKSHFPELRTFQEADWGNSAVAVSNVDPAFSGTAGAPELIRAARGGVSPENHPITGQAYWFDSAGLLRADFVAPVTTVYSAFQDWKGKKIPRVIRVYRESRLVVEIRVDSISAQ